MGSIGKNLGIFLEFLLVAESAKFHGEDGSAKVLENKECEEAKKILNIKIN